MTKHGLTTAERFALYFDKGEPSDCWPWKGGLDRGGYGQFTIGDSPVRAHRFAYELAHGAILNGPHLDHICHDIVNCTGGPTCPHRRCVNPAHLEPASAARNILRGDAPPAINARKTHCVRGHEFTPENTYERTNRCGVSRVCRTCQRLYKRKATRR